ncbi:MAG: WD40/YVTN/BNR-like repeat-containing protein [Desulfocucumaceae bacterium]
MKKFILIAITLIGSVLIPQNAHAAGTWSPQNSGVTVALNDIFFVDSQNGWCVGDLKTILHTTDGGNNWTTQLSGTFFEENFMGVYFTTLDSGWACAMSNYIYSTTDGGVNWNKGPMVTPDDMLLDIYFIDSRKGWAVGGNGSVTVPDTNWQIILKTTDGGINWVEAYRDTSIGNKTCAPLWGVSFADSLNGIAVGETGGWVLTTNDGGETWVKRDCGFEKDMVDITHLSELTFIAVGGSFGVGPAASLVVKTTDGGVSWDTCASGDTVDFLNVDFVDSLSGWTVGGWGHIRQTTDGGQTWVVQNSNTTKDLDGVFFISKYYGWVCGNSGTILKYYDPDGVEGTANSEAQIAKGKLDQNYPNPFYQSTVINYQIQMPAMVSLKLYNIAGQLIRSFELGYHKSGSYSVKWDGKDEAGRKAASGIYFYRLASNEFNSTKKMVVLR